MASKDLPPLKDSALGLVVKSQFCTKPLPPPSSTTLAGQTAIITGSNTGIGLECASQFFSLRLSHLIITVRSAEKGEHAVASLRKAYPTTRIEVWTLDKLSYDSIRTFAERCKSELAHLDIAIMNAGMIRAEFIINKATGHEQMFPVNYLSKALLALLLLPTLAKNRSLTSSPGRLTIVSSGLSLVSKFNNRGADPLIPTFDDGRGWGMNAANERYSVTKTLLTVFVLALSSHVDSASVIVNTVDPGFVGGSDLHRTIKGPMKAFLGLMKVATARSLEQGACTYVDAAVVKGVESHGSYVMDWKITP